MILPMRKPAWMMKYQAREALKNGRPEEAAPAPGGA